MAPVSYSALHYHNAMGRALWNTSSGQRVIYSRFTGHIWAYVVAQVPSHVLVVPAQL